MQYKNVILATAAAVATVSAEGYTPGQPWSTLTPSATLACGIAEYATAFGIAVQPASGASVAKRNVISQINDGQIQATHSKTSAAPTATVKTTTLAPSSKASSTSKTSSACAASATVSPKDTSCKNDGTLALTLKDGILTDGKGRVGAIVQGRQFQFDGPPPQAGSIYAAGWSITEDGNLALGDSDIFYQCLSGDFYNLYDQHIAEQCSPIHLEVVSLVDC